MTVAIDDADLGLHMAARTVLERCPEPTNALEVATVLETCGYTERRARALGAASLLDLSQAVLGLLPIYASGDRAPEIPVAKGRRSHPLAAFARGLLSSTPWLVGLATTLVAGVSFWASAIATKSVAVAVSLAAAVSLITVAPFVQAFGRRASFYLGLGDQGMVVRIHRWTLELGLATTVVAAVGLYLLREDVLGVGTPASNRLGLAAALAIGGLQVGLASFYLRRAFVAMAVVVVGGSALLVWHTVRARAYLDPVDFAVWQVRLVAVMAAVAWALSAWWLLRVTDGRYDPVWRPRGGAVLRAVGPYAAYGLAFFSVVTLPQLVGGGVWLGRYGFNSTVALIDGTAMLVLVPMLAQTMAVVEAVTIDAFPDALASYRTGEIASFRQAMRDWWRRRLLIVALLGAATCVAIDVSGMALGRGVGMLGALHSHEGVLITATIAMLLFGVGTFAAQVLLALSSPGPALRAIWAALGVLVAMSGVMSLTSTPTEAAVWSLLAASAVFGSIAVLAADRAFQQADLTYYRTM
jgi:hypothetical protein